MATPKVMTDGSTDLDETNFNKYLNAGKAQVKCNYCHITLPDATNDPNLDTAFDSDGEIVDADLSWGSNQITVTLSGFTNVPIAVANLDDNNSSNVDNVLVRPSSSAQLVLRFVSGASQTAVDPNGDVSVNLIVIGF